MPPLPGELRAAARFLGRHRATASLAVLTMGLAIGANAAVFALLNAFLSASLGVPRAHEFVNVWTTKELDGRGRVDFFDAYPNYRLLRENTRSFSSLGAALQGDATWTSAAEPRRLGGARVSASFFDVIGLNPVLGRAFSEAEDGTGAPPVAVISHALWQREFGGAPETPGRTMTLDNVPHTILGVLPAGFSQPKGTEVWRPLDLPEQLRNSVTGARQLFVYGRLAPGVTRERADVELREFAVRATEVEPANRNWSWRVQPVREALLDGADRAVWLVQAGAFVLFVLAVSNVASLLLSWTAEVRRDTAVRMALGAPAGRLRRRFFAQSAVLAAAGGVAGVGVAAAGLTLFKRFNPNPSLAPFIEQAAIDPTTLAFIALAVTAVALTAGLLPAWQARAIDLLETLRSDGRGLSAGRGIVRWQQALVVVQAAVSALVLAAAAIAAVVFLRVARVEPGFAADDRVVFRVQFPEPAYAGHDERSALVRRFEANLAGDPAVRAAGVTSTLPVADVQWGGGFLPERADGSFPEEALILHFRRTSPGYLPALGAPLHEGRFFSPDDRADTPPVAIVSEALARRCWPGGSALGKHLRRSALPDAPPLEIVGVVGTVRDAGPAAPGGETVYVPFNQLSTRRVSVLLHASHSPADALAAARRALAAASPDVALSDVASLEDLSAATTALPRLQATLLGVFALLAAGVASLGSYGVMTQVVGVRRRELAIRVALGATPRRVTRSVLLLNGRLVALGVAVGLLGAWLAAGWFGSIVAGFAMLPAWPYAVVAAGIIAITQLASWIPARRAGQANACEVLEG